MAPAHRPDACIGDRCSIGRDPSRSPSIGAGSLSHLARIDRDLAGEQIRDFVITETSLSQDLTRMLAQSRRRMAQPAVCLAEPHRWPDDTNGSLCGMLGLGKHIYRGEVLVGGQFGEGVDRS